LPQGTNMLSTARMALFDTSITLRTGRATVQTPRPQPHGH
jgi:hypothetical protein